MAARFIGQRIKNRRRELGYTQEYLAELVGSNPKTISDYERNVQTNIHINTLIAIAHVLKKPVAFFFEDDNQDDSEAVLLNEFRALPTEKARASAIGLLRVLHTYIETE